MKLIDADELRKRMYHDAFEMDSDMQRWDSGCWVRYKMFENAIEDMPLIEAEPVRRGKWLEHPYEREWDICSCCKIGTKRREFGMTDEGREWVTEESYTYCPWCGANMEYEK